VQAKASREAELSHDDTKVRQLDYVQYPNVLAQEIPSMEKAEQFNAIKEEHIRRLICSGEQQSS